MRRLMLKRDDRRIVLVGERNLGRTSDPCKHGHFVEQKRPLYTDVKTR